MRDPSTGSGQGANGLQYFLTDHLGSTVAVTNASGTLTSQQRYLPFGQPRADVATPNSQFSLTGLSYTGQRQLDEGTGGLMDYKARFYSSALGRFIQPDSIIPNAGNPQAFYRYSYVGNNPVNFNDPTGHCTRASYSTRIVTDMECEELPTSSGGGFNLNDYLGSDGGNPGGNDDDDKDPEDYTYHLHSDTNLYKLGWENFGQV